ncbi:BTB/POZ domain-containing protein 17-like [Planococcus citri]|uniref:BTB/POZ domain-containing protein 17-like n=1 Tax=Planococcus citri TaxID=170843 RepID=UPI0031FA3552
MSDRANSTNRMSEPSCSMETEVDSSGENRQKRKNSHQDVEIDNSQQVLKKIATLYAEKLMNDICLVVDGVEFPAHRLILCTSSEVFHVMLMNPQWCESQESRIVLQETPQCSAIFGEFLRYFYTGQIRISQSTIMGILTLADKYNVKDLIALCIEYMYSHIAEAAVHGQIVTWYQYALSLAHYQLSSDKRSRDTEVWKDKPSVISKPITSQWDLLRRACRNFIKWNFELVANTKDFGNFQSDVLSMLLQQNDLVVSSEMALYNYVVKWLDIQYERILDETANETEADKQIMILINLVMSNIRFPMMDSRQLAGLLLSSLVMKYKDFFIEKMAVGVAFHKGERNEKIDELQCSENGKLLFTPRLYTAEQWSSSIVINNFSGLPSYHPRTLVCTSPPTLRENLFEQTCEWVIDLYPKGLCFQKCFLIVWQGTITIPEVVITTVRMSITCREPPAKGSYLVKIGVLVSGITSGVENVVEVAYYIRKFSKNDNTFNINDLLSYQKLNDRFNNLSPKCGDAISEAPYLIGADRDTLKLQVVIIPLCSELSQIDESYNSSYK